MLYAKVYIECSTRQSAQSLILSVRSGETTCVDVVPSVPRG